jgi:type IV pilus assembly protein PilX
MRTQSCPQLRSREAGAALVISLVLLLVLTVLGVSGMNSATMEVTMAGNTQFQEDAFQEAEDAIDITIAQRHYPTDGTPFLTPWTGDPDYDRQGVQTYVGRTPVPDRAFSMGASTGSIVAHHFDILSVGRGPRGASSTHHQSFYIVGPNF